MRILLFGDMKGIPLSLRHLPTDCLVAIVAAQNRPAGHGELRTIAERRGIPFLIQPRPSAPTLPFFMDQIRYLKPDLILVNSYSMLLPSELLDTARVGGVNIHGGLLPGYRGANPIQWALLNNETETGVTMHVMNGAFDAGPVIAQRCVPILLSDTWIEIMDRISEASEAMLAEELPRLLRGDIRATAQDEAQAHHYRRRTPEDGRFDWGWRVLDVFNLIRGLTRPNPGAFFIAGDGQRMVFDSYQTLSEITAAKHLHGSLRLSQDEITLAPQPDKDVATVGFDVRSTRDGQRVGHVRLTNICLTHLSAQVEVSDMDDHAKRTAVSVLSQFASEELRLHHLSACVVASRNVSLSSFDHVGFLTEAILQQGHFS